MSSDIYFRRDIANILRAVASAAEGPQTDNETDDRYVQGWHDGLETGLIAAGLACGLHQMVSKERQDGPRWVKMDRGAGQ